MLKYAKKFMIFVEGEGAEAGAGRGRCERRDARGAGGVRVLVREGSKLESGASAGAGVWVQELVAEIRDYGAFVRELNAEIRDSCHF